ncbi:MAG: DDE-type integrase/transposase/recombinase [Alphaproteobacteria bacterium]|nr:DDE-type integrase/transposase/recombinase [Alphaproteobacteria bacterium]MBO6629700.1 DDE-type integrase/transposase/recombinase [Alphaproteobacteria bacterium]
MYFSRAIDQEGGVLDFLVQSKRDTPAALKLMRRLLKNQGVAPKIISGTNGMPMPRHSTS